MYPVSLLLFLRGLKQRYAPVSCDLHPECTLETKRVIEEAGGVCLGITCVVDRTKPEAPSPIPIVASALKLDLPNYAPEECPICKEGKLPLVHLGSRKMKQEAKQTL